MAISERRRGILVKREGTYGQDSNPIAGTDGVLIKSLNCFPLEQEYVERTLVRQAHGGFEQKPVKKYVRLELEVDATGFGTAGPATPLPGLAALFELCGHSETIDAGVDVDYDPVSENQVSGTIYFYQDGMLHIATGCYGTFTLQMTNEQLPVYRFEIWGLFNLPTDVALPAIDNSGWPDVFAITPQNTTAFGLHGYTEACLQSFEFSQNNEVIVRSRPGCGERLIIVDRAPTGRVQFEATLMATQDWYTPILNAVKDGLNITHGPAGNQVQFLSSFAQLTQPQFQAEDKIVDLGMDVRFIPSLGDDEYQLKLA